MKEYIKDNMKLYNRDCMEGMAEYPDNYFDLAIVDPPYGINASQGVGLHSRKKFEYKNKDWDSSTPKKSYWDELFRVSIDQIVCGANYFLEYLYSSKSFICWVKNNPAPNFAQAEFLWTSTNINGKVYDSGRQIQHEIMSEGGSMHPTQKPVKLYSWLLQNYSSPEHKILDTHLGSASHAIAWHYFQKGGEFVGYELDSEYFDKSIARIEQETAQISMF